MRLPRLRFTVRRLMLVVVIGAIALGRMTQVDVGFPTGNGAWK